ncbi:MAG TPA: flagellar hook-associated protein FlgK [Polyangiaceae bacterium]|nr:flagellar hook-associated protein FlgK [Polyangiaceae bacterium]
MSSSLSQLLYTARDGLTAQSYGLGVTGQNISNVNTPGYVRREALLETRALGDAGSVNAAGIRRVTDVFLERRQYETTGLSSAASEHDKDLANIEALFNDQSGTGLGSSLDQVFKSFSALASNPSDPTTRDGVLDAADEFAKRVNDTANAIADAQKGLFQAAQATVQEINQKAQEIAKLNEQIAQAEAAGQSAADLRDKRSQLLMSLSGMVDVRTVQSGDSLTVQVSGATLVDGAAPRSLSIGLDATGAMQVLSSSGNGSTAQDVTKFLTGGKLAGIREARDVDLVAVGKQLDQFAYDVGTAINTQHAAGFGLDGVTGRHLFDLTATATGAARAIRLSDDVAGNPAAVAASSSAATLPGGSDNAALLSAMSRTPIASGGTRTASDAYGDIVGDIASRRSASSQMLEAREAISAQVDSMHESMSGVSLDEEFVNLTKFQRAYQASARLLTTADQLLQDLIQRV